MIITEKQIAQLQYLLQEFISISSLILALQNNPRMETLFTESKNLLVAIANQQSPELKEVKDD
jgi:hypothetical protein